MGRESEGREGGADVGGMGGAGRAAGDADTLGRQEIQHGLGFDVGEGEVEHVRGAVALGDVQLHPHVTELPFQTVAEGGHVGAVTGAGGKACLCRRTKAADAHGVLGSRPQTALLTSAGKVGDDALGLDDVGMDVQRAHALGAVDLMGADRHQVGMNGGRSKGDLQESLHRVTVGHSTAVLGLGGGKDTSHVEVGSRLVVDHHHGDQHGGLLQSGDGGFNIQHTALGGDTHHLQAVGLQAFHGLLHRGMLTVSDDDPISKSAGLGVDRAVDGQGRGLGAAGGEDQLVGLDRLDPQSRPHLSAGAVQKCMCRLTYAVEGGRISEGLHSLGHGGDRLGTQRRRSRIIQINTLHNDF